MSKASRKKITYEARKGENKLLKWGVRKGRVASTTRRIKRELHNLAIRSPGFAPVKKHTIFVKRLANTLAKELRRRRIAVDRGLVNQAALAHDSRRDSKNPYADIESQVFFAKRGAPEIARAIHEGESWNLRNYGHWSIEKKIVSYSDTTCRGVKFGNSFVNGILPSKTAFRLLISQRNADPVRVDALVRERQGVEKFEKELLSEGFDINLVVSEHMKRNPKSFEGLVEKQIASANVDKIIKASMKRLGIKKLNF